MVSALPPGPVTRAPVLVTTPVVIRGSDVLGKVRQWTPEHISERLADREIPISIADADGAFRYNPDAREGLRFEPMRGSRLAAEFRATAVDRKLCMQQMPIASALPELSDELTIPSWVPTGKINEVNLWMASAGSSTPLHYDDMHNLFAQIEGRKKFLLFNPDQFDRLYPGPLNTRSQHLSRLDMKAPDLLRFPKAEQAEYWEAVVLPGDLLFMPAFWWHQVSAPDLAVSVNYWWRADVRDCLVPAFFRQLYMNSVLENVRGLMAEFDFSGLGSGLDAVLALADRVVEHGEEGGAARLCGGVVVAAVEDACRERGIADGDTGIDGVLAQLEQRGIWSADTCGTARRTLALAGSARPGLGLPPGDVRATIERLRGSGPEWRPAADGPGQ